MKIGGWLEKRLDDPKAILACVKSFKVDLPLADRIERALNEQKTDLPAPYEKAWRLIIKSARNKRDVFGSSWFSVKKRIEAGTIDADVREGIASSLQPQLRLSSPWTLDLEENDGEENLPPQTLSSLLKVDFEPEDWPTPDEVLQTWPADADADVDVLLIHSLENQLFIALEEAKSADYISATYERSDWEVKSVSQHKQDRHSGGFYPITRLIADLWVRLDGKDPNAARKIAKDWTRFPFLLFLRLRLYALNSPSFSTDEVTHELISISDADFFLSGCRRETMVILGSRWDELSTQQKEKIEHRILQSLPKEIVDKLDLDTDSISRTKDWEVFIRLARIVNGGGTLSEKTYAIFEDIQGKFPKWKVDATERNDFSSWFEMRSGPTGDVSVLSNVPVENLIDEAFTKAAENPLDQGDLWRVFCSTDPNKAFDALRHNAASGDWNIKAWQEFFWESRTEDSPERSSEICKLLLIAPTDFHAKLDALVTGWLKRAKSSLIDNSELMFSLWDLYANISAPEIDTDPVEEHSSLDILTEAINSAPGHLAEFIIEELSSLKPKSGDGLPPFLSPKFQLLVNAKGYPGLLARCVFASQLSFLHAVAPEWVRENLLTYFSWESLEATQMWSSRAYDVFGSVDLFSDTKDDFLQLFERSDVHEQTKRNMTERLISAALSNYDGGPILNLSSSETRRALRRGGKVVRSTASWMFWRRLHGASDPDKESVWRDIVKPAFLNVWPLDADLRESETARDLARLAILCKTAMPDAVKTLSPYIVPHPVYFLFDLEREHINDLIENYPNDILELVYLSVGECPKEWPHGIDDFLSKLKSVDKNIVQNQRFGALYRIARP